MVRENMTLEMKNVLSFRGKMTQQELAAAYCIADIIGE